MGSVEGTFLLNSDEPSSKLKIKKQQTVKTEKGGSKMHSKSSKVVKMSKRKMILNKLVNEFREQDSVSGPLGLPRVAKIKATHPKAELSESSSQVPEPIPATSPTMGGA